MGGQLDITVGDKQVKTLKRFFLQLGTRSGVSARFDKKRR